MYKKILTLTFVMIAVFLFYSNEALAVDYSITNVEIDAQLHSDGDVSVQEQHTYQFDGEFNGIIRELIPKENTEITNFAAYEDDRKLDVEKDKTEYRIHRKGEDETINVTLVYEIKQGIDVYRDVAEFYWPFFDRSNESDYHNMTINVYPPEPTTDVIAFGYDEAYKKEYILQDGHVQFQMGEVSSKRNGDIRVAYDAAMFSKAAVVIDKPMRDEIEAAHQHLIEEEIAKAERKELYSTIGMYLIPIITGLILIIFLRARLASRNMKFAILRELEGRNGIPVQRLSLPTTIYFLKQRIIVPEIITAALFDLVRKGYVEKQGKEQFRLMNRNGVLEHERLLIEWLFDEIGTNTIFSFSHLKDYTANKSNHSKYVQYQSKWQKALEAELKEAKLYDNKVKTRMFASLLGIILIPFLVLFIINDLYALFIVTLILFSALFIFAIGYRPKSWQGTKITVEWGRFRDQLLKISDVNWQKFPEDDKLRTFIFGLGMKDKQLMKKNESLINHFKINFNSLNQSTLHSIDPSWIILASIATSNFSTASQDMSVSSSSSGSTGSGAGGGGGGSGAF